MPVCVCMSPILSFFFINLWFLHASDNNQTPVTFQKIYCGYSRTIQADDSFRPSWIRRIILGPRGGGGVFYDFSNDCVAFIFMASSRCYWTAWLWWTWRQHDPSKCQSRSKRESRIQAQLSLSYTSVRADVKSKLKLFPSSVLTITGVSGLIFCVVCRQCYQLR
jgi:hypothetical protein